MKTIPGYVYESQESLPPVHNSRNLESSNMINPIMNVQIKVNIHHSQDAAYDERDSRGGNELLDVCYTDSISSQDD